MYPDGKNILVIDCEAPRRQLAERVLRDEGFAVTAVAEGFSALRAAAGRRFALTVMAIELPGAPDAAATLRHLRTRQPWLKALFTGRPAHRAALAACDCEDFIAAPFHRRDLLGCVFELLQRDGDNRCVLSLDRSRAG